MKQPRLMHVLVTAHSIAPSSGGLRVGVLGICKGLIGRGHSVTLIATSADVKGAFSVPLGVPTLVDGVTVYFYSSQLSVFGNVFSLSLARALKLQVQQADLVLIHSLYQFMSTVAAYYSRRYKVPYVLRPHGTLDSFLVFRRRWLLKWAYFRLFEERNFRNAAAIQYSSQMEAEMTARFIKSKVNGIIISEGIDQADFHTLPLRGMFRNRFPEMADKLLILFFGRFHQKKGLELLIESFALIAHRYPNAHLVLAGSGDQEYMNRIAGMLNKFGLSHRSTITGQLDEGDKRAVLVDADLFVLPSHGENFGIAVVEAMACGLPVLISDRVGIWPEVAAYEAGMVTISDPNRIADAMETLFNDVVLRFKLGQNGKILVEERFNIDRMAERMETEYQALVMQGRHMVVEV